MREKNQATRLETLEAEKWRLAKAMDEGKTISETMLVMMALNDVAMQIYYEKMRLSGKSKTQAKKELLKVLESSGFKYAAEVRKIA